MPLKTYGAVLGVLPGGRGNDFARTVGIPLDAEAACEVIAHGEARPIDLGLARDADPPPAFVAETLAQLLLGHDR